MSTRTELSPEEFGDRLRRRAQERRSRGSELSAPRIAYRKAASLLWQFDPRTLRLPEGIDARTRVGGAVLSLITDCTARPAREGIRWQLREEVRQTALASFAGVAEAARYLAANQADIEPGSTPAFVLALLRDEPQRLDILDERSLSRLREAVTWLRAVPGASTSVDEREIDAVLERLRLLQPLRALLEQTFEGRLIELDRVREHIGLLRSRTWGGMVTRAGRSAAELLGQANEDYPLIVYGPGGIGKSTLLAKSLMDHLTDSSVSELPFVYVDSERATISLHEPLSLLAEMSRQLAVQYPEHSSAFGDLSSSARARAREQRLRAETVEDLSQVSSTKQLSRAASHEQHVSAREEEARASGELGRILSVAVRSSPPPPFVVVLDSFEEAQYRASPILDRMWSMFAALRTVYPRTRLIVAGRAPVGHPSIPAEDLPTLALGELDLDAAARFLVDRGVGPRIAEALTARVGGNPLSLQLAARVCEAQSQAGQDDAWVLEVPTRRRRFFGAVNDMLIQGMLYDRLLEHITNPIARALAHPGLALRRITPDLIRIVLAPHCGVGVPDEATALMWFEELARELDLVELVDTYELRHRPDVRRVMLRLMTADRNSAVRAVEMAAVDFYARSTRPADRVEELYHRLRLGGDLRAVKERWVPRAAELAGAESEFPRRSARVLSRLIEGADEIPPALDDQVEWEQRTAAVVEDLLIQGNVTAARALLRQQRPWTPCSPLHVLDVEVLLRLGERDGARRALTLALEADDAEQCGEVRIELLQLSARMHADSGELDCADADLELAERTASREGQELDALGVLLTRARLHERAAPESPQDVAAEEALITRVRNTDGATLTTRPALLRAIAAEVGARAPEILAQAVALVGMPALPSGAIMLLANAVVRALDVPGVAKVLADAAGQSTERWTRPDVGEVARLIENANSTGRLDEVARRLLATPDETGELTQGIAAAMVEGVVGPHA